MDGSANKTSEEMQTHDASNERFYRNKNLTN